MTIAEQLKNGRAEKRLSQAEAADLAGISRRTLSYYESGERTPNAETLLKLCELYSISAETVIAADMGMPDEAKETNTALQDKIDEYLTYERNKKKALGRGALVFFAVISAAVLVTVLVLCILRFRLEIVYGYTFSEATAALWTGLFQALIEFVNDETVQSTPIVSIVIVSAILLGWGVYFLIYFLRRKKKGGSL